MNRRNFIGNLLALGAGFTILPPAATSRIWKATRQSPHLELIMPAHEFNPAEFVGNWRFVNAAPIFDRRIIENIVDSLHPYPYELPLHQLP